MRSFLLSSIITLLSTSRYSHAQTNIDLTSANRRPAVPGLPDWSKVGFMQGSQPLPDDGKITRVVSAEILAGQYGVIANDGIDDTNGLQRAISDCRDQSQAPNYTLLQLPSGVINLSHTVYVNANYLVIRGAGNDPENGGTQIVFTPDENTKYDVLTADGSQWDISGMSFEWDLPAEGNQGRSTGSASSGWLWPGRSIFRIGSKEIASKFLRAAGVAPSNRVDLFYGTVNYHWRIDRGTTKGFMASQARDIAGYKDTDRVFISNASEYEWATGTQVWIASPVRSQDYTDWGVTTTSYFVNSYVYQDWFTVTGMGQDPELGSYLDLDHSLRFDVYANSASAGSPPMEEDVTFAKVMPISDPITNVGIENVYMTQPIEGLSPADAQRNYGNLAPEKAMHGIVLRYAKDSWIRNIRTFMTGSHPVATEGARNIQIQDSYFDGAWNKGKGGNGYLRGSRVWDSLFFNLTQRNLRHFTFQWSAMGNVASFLNVSNDLNLHGGYEGYNLLELNLVNPAYSHRAESCTANCGGEGGSSEGGMWWPIYWATGEKASKWSGATGPQNVFYRNYLRKQTEPNADYIDYQPYFSSDGSQKDTIWQFGWDRNSDAGDHYQHLSLSSSCEKGSCLLQDWQGHEQVNYHSDPTIGVNGRRKDSYTSLFLRDVSAATTGVSKFSSISGATFCRGNVEPKSVGYYLSSAASRSCSAFSPSSIDTKKYTHIIFGYASLASDGTLSVPSGDVPNLQAVVGLKNQNPGLKVYLAVGGYGLGADASAIQRIATNGSGRSRLASTSKALLEAYNLDGLDLEWATGITASQFSVIAGVVKTAFGANHLLSLSTPSAFWDLSGVNRVTEAISTNAEFVSLITHSNAQANSVTNIQATLKKVVTAGLSIGKVLMGVPFYARSVGSDRTSQCLQSSTVGKGTFPYYAVDSIWHGGEYDSDAWEAFNLDEDDRSASLTLSDGSQLLFDAAETVAYKSDLALDICMGGVAVFSIDQDDAGRTLTNALSLA